MTQFLESEKKHQENFKLTSKTISSEARNAGEYKGKTRPFCLPANLSEQNLFPDIRISAINFFKENSIKWHDGKNSNPSNHLCDSQVCCVNFLFPFANKPDSLAKVLRPFFPELEKMLPVEKEQFVSFEWIGKENYLGERITRNGQRTRGANFTSADAIVKFERNDKKKQIVLIEWKYTESYGSIDKKIAASGTDRSLIYQHLYNKIECPVNKNILPDFDALFYEPFYQLMRQQFLAHEMEKAHELDADIVSLLHIAPNLNKDFRRVTSPSLESLGESVTSVWTKLVNDKSRFLSLNTEILFGKQNIENLHEMESWIKYISSRYSFIIS